MNWRNVKLIWHRELRDQFRDRRSLFMVAVLPVLLYPMLGALMMQLAGFLRDHNTQVWVIGAEQLDGITPPLFADKQFALSLFAPGSQPPKFALKFHDSAGNDNNQLRIAREALTSGDSDVVVYFPPGFADEITRLQSPATESANRKSLGAREPPRPTVYFNSAKEASDAGQMRVERMLDLWQTQLIRGNLEARDVPADVAAPFSVNPQDVAPSGGRETRTWSRLLPFIVFIWALTGAFYPAVDLCAGEKERGTLESLLTSPALRSEIVSGKLLTVITFSISSALANLASMALTGKVVMAQFGMQPPPLSAFVWLVVALIPMSALFSALALAVAAFARSTKEGQYYLMPLLLCSLPLMVLPLAPNVELNLGTSLIPITGMVLLLRSAIEGDIGPALPYLLTVTIVTLICCWLAIRWAVAQFNSETVLFRESENFSPGLWLRKLYIDRPAVQGGGAAMACIAAIYFLQFTTRGILTDFGTVGGMAKIALLSQACVLIPPLVGAFLLAGQPGRALALSPKPSLWKPMGAVLLAVLLHPLALQVGTWIFEIFPPSGDFEQFSQAIAVLPLWLRLVLLGLVPAVVEELAFRGFVLVGLRKSTTGWSAVAVSAVAFGFSHGILQQSLSASLLGLLLGWIAVRTGSIWTGVAYHATHNGLLHLRNQYAAELQQWLLQNQLGWVTGGAGDDALPHSPAFTTICTVIAAGLIWAICRNRAADQLPKVG